MASQTVITGILCLIVFTLASEKRILLNDPDYMSQQLTHLQSELQELRVKGESQEQTVTTLQQTVSTLQQTVTKQQQTISSLQQNADGKGVVYTRWGRTDCPTDSDTQLVYTGYIGGSDYHHSGGAANALCMPSDPTWGPYKNTPLSYGQGYVYGSEYKETTEFGMANLSEDATCAVCRNTAHSAVKMIPARTTCYPGWTEAYRGLLTVGYPSDAAASEYRCTHEHPQATTGGGNKNDVGVSIFAVWSKCGSLPCPPYEDSKVVSCVVCMI